jgi:hypothetical protein
VDPDKLNKVEKLLKEQGFKPFKVELGGKGVGVLENVDEKVVDSFEHSVASLAEDGKAWVYWN